VPAHLQKLQITLTALPAHISAKISKADGLTHFWWHYLAQLALISNSNVRTFLTNLNASIILTRPNNRKYEAVVDTWVLMQRQAMQQTKYGNPGFL
jgi:hypothetical protein